MTDESPLARALRIAMQNHPTRNALDQGDYGYGTPVNYTEPRFPFSSSAMEKRGPWMREYMSSTLADLLSQILTYAPMAVPAMRGRVMEGGLRPQDYAIGPAKDRAATKTGTSYQDEFQSLISGRPGSELGSAHMPEYYSGFSQPTNWHNYGMHPADMLPHRAPRPSNLNSIPEEATFNVNAPLTADEISTLMRLQGRKPFETIPGGKE